MAPSLGFPNRVKSMCCIMSTSGEGDLPTTKLKVILQLAKPVPEEREKYIRSMLDTISVISGSYYDEAFSRQCMEMAYDRSNYRGGFPRQSAALVAAAGRRSALVNVKVPTLVIHGKEDPMLPPKNGIDIHQSIPGSELMLIDGMGHIVPEPLYDLLTEAIARNAMKGCAQGH
eukprot:GGOE01022063.1.p1 GENE.GGOE01022063.1~~GGOE01022063.1.p1  ORF type:complete len:173 (-),score=36.83 GGOE01022063.1:392-910(-)